MYESFEPMPESSGAEYAAAMRAAQGQTQRAWDSSWNYQRARASGNRAEIRAARAGARQAWETEMRTKGTFFGGIGKFPPPAPIRDAGDTGEAPRDSAVDDLVSEYLDNPLLKGDKTLKGILGNTPNYVVILIVIFLAMGLGFYAHRS